MSIMAGDPSATRPPKAAELVADEIRTSIAEGRLKPGERLPSQPELAEMFTVSAPTLREALRILETDGLVSVRRGVKGGTVVNEPNLTAMSRQLGLYLQIHKATLGDIYEFRLALEPTAVGLLATRFTPDIRRELLQQIEALQEAIDHGDVTTSAALAARFHEVLMENCGNVVFASLAGVVSETYKRSIGTAVRAAGRENDLKARARIQIKRQVKLLDLLTAGNQAAAERLSRKMLVEEVDYLTDLGTIDASMDS